MTKYRIIERNDGKYQYEWQHSITADWHRIDYLIFETEAAARGSLIAILEFCAKHATKRVVDEIEVGHE